MAEILGENGAVYFNAELTNLATTGSLVFSTGGTITSSTASGSTGPFIDFESTGYTIGMLITVSGCEHGVGSTDSTTGNNRTYTITDVSSGTLTVSEAISVGTTAAEALAVTFLEADPGVPVLGFFNWALSYISDTLDTTDFDDSSGGRSYIPGLTSWTVTAEKHFLDANNEVDDWVGQTCELRLFLNYVAIPASTDSSQYWKGDTVVTGLDMTTPVDALINQSISFQGDKALTLKTQTKAWNLGIST